MDLNQRVNHQTVALAAANEKWIGESIDVNDDGEYICRPCEKTYPTFDKLGKHTLRVHNIGKKLLKKYCIDSLTNVNQPSNDELQHIALSQVYEWSFLCRTCNRRIGFQNCKRHFTEGVHSFIAADIELWTSVQLGSALRHGKQNKARQLRDALAQNCQPEVGASEFDDEAMEPCDARGMEDGSEASRNDHEHDEADAHADAATSNVERCLKTLSQNVVGLTEAMTTRRNPAVEEPVPQLALDERAIIWRDVAAGKKQRKWPLPKPCSFNLTALRAFIASRVGSPATADSYILGVRYFLSLFADPLEECSLGALLATLYKDGLFKRMLSLDILSRKLPWTRKIFDALEHVFEYVEIAAGENNHKEILRCVQLLRASLIPPIRKQLHMEQEAQRLHCATKTHEKIQQLPSMEEIKEAVAQAFVDIHTIHVAYAHDPSSMPPSVRNALNVCMCGIIVYNSYAGRPFEWETLKRSVVITLLSTNDDYITVSEHKTCRTMGALGRYVPPGTKTAMSKIAELSTHEQNESFLIPARSTGKRVHLYDLSKKFGAAYTPGRSFANSTLIRKWQETIVNRPTSGSKCNEMMARIAAHKLKTQKKWYLVTTPQEDAMKAKGFVDAFMQGSVQWPSDDTLKTHENRTVEDVLRQLKGRPATAAVSNELRSETCDDEGMEHYAEEGGEEEIPAEDDSCVDAAEADDTFQMAIMDSLAGLGQVVGATAKVVNFCDGGIVDGSHVRLHKFNFIDRSWDVTSGSDPTAAGRVPMANIAAEDLTDDDEESHDKQAAPSTAAAPAEPLVKRRRGRLAAIVA